MDRMEEHFLEHEVYAITKSWNSGKDIDGSSISGQNSQPQTTDSPSILINSLCSHYCPNAVLLCSQRRGQRFLIKLLLGSREPRGSTFSQVKWVYAKQEKQLIMGFGLFYKWMHGIISRRKYNPFHNSNQVGRLKGLRIFFTLPFHCWWSKKSHLQNWFTSFDHQSICSTLSRFPVGMRLEIDTLEIVDAPHVQRSYRPNI
jgi:hypothetical protein